MCPAKILLRNSKIFEKTPSKRRDFSAYKPQKKTFRKEGFLTVEMRLDFLRRLFLFVFSDVKERQAVGAQMSAYDGADAVYYDVFITEFILDFLF